MTEALRAGKACVVFPEGTRSVDGRLQRLKGGVLLMAAGIFWMMKIVSIDV